MLNSRWKIALFFFPPWLSKKKRPPGKLCLTSTPTKILPALLTGSVIGLFMLWQACHADKDPLRRHSSGDSLFGGGAERKMATLGKYLQGRRCIRHVCSTACVDWMCVIECAHSSIDLLVPASVSALSTYLLCAHKGGPNWLPQRRCDDSHCGTTWSRAGIDTSQASFIDESLTYKINLNKHWATCSQSASGHRAFKAWITWFFGFFENDYMCPSD